MEGAIFNERKLEYLNGFYVRQKSTQKITELCIPYLIKDGLIKKNGQATVKLGEKKKTEKLNLFDETSEYVINETKEGISFEILTSIVSIYQERLKKLSEISELTDFFFKNNLDYDKDLFVWKNMSDKEIKDNLDYDKDLFVWKNMSDKEIKDSFDKLESLLSKIKNENWTKEILESTLLVEEEKIGDRGSLLWPLRVSLTNKKNSAGPFEIAEILGKEKTIGRIENVLKLF